MPRDISQALPPISTAHSQNSGRRGASARSADAISQQRRALIPPPREAQPRSYYQQIVPRLATGGAAAVQQEVPRPATGGAAADQQEVPRQATGGAAAVQQEVPRLATGGAAAEGGGLSVGGGFLGAGDLCGVLAGSGGMSGFLPSSMRLTTGGSGPPAGWSK